MVWTDLGPAARILTEEFYSHKTNFITFQIERLKTVLSLESTFPNQNSLRKDYLRQTLQRMIVACDAKNGQVVGFAEVDARSLSSYKNGSSGNEASLTEGASDDILRSYMYNLAVDKKWKRKGIASALVQACEQYVSDMHDLCVEKRLYLRVRKSNHAAIALYESLGYREMSPEVIHLSQDDINSGSLEDGELILFAKDLLLGGECPLD
jgi:ribosomal protein S18 acetylase RimI-like enzyme